MNNDTIYFHAPCFDGLISAVIARDYLETQNGWNIKNLEPITYTMVDEKWLNSPLNDRSAIVDFLYHPQADFWMDHHQTSFLNEISRLDYENNLLNGSNKLRKLIYDMKSPAGANLLWSHVSQYSSDKKRFGDMVKWATITDSVAFATPEDAVFGDAPALQIAQTLGQGIVPDRLRMIINALQKMTLEEVAAMSIIAKPFSQLRPKIEAGLEDILKHLVVDEENSIMTYETTLKKDVQLPRFGPFLLRPDIRYMTSLVHSETGTKMSSSRNVWGTETYANLGEIFRSYGGGGHHGVGSFALPTGNIQKSRDIISGAIKQIKDAENSQKINAYKTL